MPCKNCSSVSQQDLQIKVDLRVTPSEVKRFNLSPVCVCQRTLVCMDCGYTELVVPAIDLESLRKEMAAFDPKDETVNIGRHTVPRLS